MSKEIQITYLLNIPILEKIADIPLFRPLKLKDIGLKKKKLCRGIGIERCKFDGSLIDFYCWLSTMNLAYHLALCSIKPNTIYLDIITDACPSDLPNTMRLYLKNKDYLVNGVKQNIEEYLKKENIPEENIKNAIDKLLKLANKKIKLTMDFQEVMP